MKRLVGLVLVSVAAVGLHISPANAADTKPPKIVAAATSDENINGQIDRITLTYNEKIKHTADSDGTYPFTVTGYTILSVGVASGKTLPITLQESGAPNTTATPPVSYTRTNSKPVRDIAGNQAKAQLFTATTTPDPDGDGYTTAQGDCNQADAAIHPGVTDMPDTSFLDKNCDGIDGEAASATFVRTSGSGTLCTQAAPCETVQKGIDAAVINSKRDVYVAGGTYPNGAIELADGVNVFGGFGQNFQRDPAKSTGSRTAIIEGSDAFLPIGSQSAAMVAQSLTQPTIVADLTFDGANMTQGPSPNQASAMTVVVIDSGSALTLLRNTIKAGDGAAGITGTSGTNASTTSATPAMAGGNGGNGAEFTTACDNSSHGAGGSAGVNAGTSGLVTVGGAGGAGGTMDTNCTPPFDFDFDASAGADGANAGSTTLSFGFGGTGGSGKSLCGSATNGNPGFVRNGAAGTANVGGFLVNGFPAQRAGNAGSIGENGSGGGGGGGAGGCDVGTDSFGAGGGGGGAGGARASSGGGGGGGGSSIAIFVSNSSPFISDNTVVRGAGGAGGAGGVGGQGQSGGPGGAGGLLHPGGVAAGSGGNGAHGGHGGGGAGGQGGDSLGVLMTAGSTVTLSGNTFSGGTAGSGGAGGLSAPLAPVIERDGNIGQAGHAGRVDNTFTCASSFNC